MTDLTRVSDLHHISDVSCDLTQTHTAGTADANRKKSGLDVQRDAKIFVFRD